MAERFFVPGPLHVGEVLLTGPEAHHLAVVRRFGPGDLVTLFNGDGAEYPAEVLEASKKSVVLMVQSRREIDRESRRPVVVAVPWPKADRADFLIEKLTEIGVQTVVPLRTERSIVSLKPAMIERARRGVIEASKQCGRNQLMEVIDPLDWPVWLGQQSQWPPGPRWVWHFSERSLADSPSWSAWCRRATGDPPAAALVSIGPEGGFTPAEVSAAVAAGWELVQWQSRTLRMETAAMVAAAMLLSPV